MELFVQADISTRAGVDKVVWQVLNPFGGLDILIHNAGGSAAQGEYVIDGGTIPTV